MPLQKQSVNITFAKGLDLKTDPFQVNVGNFLSLQNSIFDKGGQLQKRNGYIQLANLPNAESVYATTFNSNLLTIGTDLFAYNQSNNTWVTKGSIQPLSLTTLPLIRTNTNQSYADSAIAPNGLICTVYTDNVPSGSSTVPVYKYVVANSVTGQNIVSPTIIVPTSGTVLYAPRVFLLGNHFLIMFTNVISSVNHLEYFTISTANPLNVTPNVSLSAQYTPVSTGGFDGVVADGALFVAWNGNDGGGAIHITKIDAQLNIYVQTIFTGHAATIITLAADSTVSPNIIYVSYYSSGTQLGYTLAVDQSLNTILAPTQIISSTAVVNIASVAENQVCNVYYEVTNAYGYDSSIPTNYIKTVSITQAGSVGSTSILVRGVGLASKACLVNGMPYFLVIYESTFQPSYFLLNGDGQVISKLAYSNGSGTYYVTGLPTALVNNNVIQVPYLYKDLVQAINTTQGVTNAAGVYSQTGINLASFDLESTISTSSEIGSNINMPAGFVWMYDGYSIVENNFFLWPDSVEGTASSTGGLMASQIYFYQATYEWSDNQGNLFRSTPSIPVKVDASGLGTSTVSVTINVPTLRLTYKTNNPVKIVLYRWSTAQQIYYQVTSILVPLFNSLSSDYVTFVDTSSDASIAGNNIIYTTGGVLEDISPPPADTMTLFNSRLWLVDSEDKNLLWFSKQVIEGTPVEMSDLLTIYVAPTISAQGNTGPITALSAMDDKLIIFKKDAIYYINGIGPDNTGANSQYSDPIFITATVGSSIQQSIVLMPNGLMFQSDKGIWLLGRDLSTTYIGAPVESLTSNGATVLSAINVPGTNQIRFTMSTNVTLMYDYYYQQWGTFVNIPAISSTLYESLHTYVNKYGEVFQESPGSYLDGTLPVLMSFTTSWLNLAGLQGYERAYFFYLLGVYLSPHKLAVQIAYNYNASPTQQSIIIPTNFSANWGQEALWGSSPQWGGNQNSNVNIENWRVFLQTQKCESFQVTIKELYDTSYGYPAGAGLTLSGLNMVVGLKKGYPRRLGPSNQIG